jgi:hypothetical protein
MNEYTNRRRTCWGVINLIFALRSNQRRDVVIIRPQQIIFGAISNHLTNSTLSDQRDCTLQERIQDSEIGGRGVKI